MRARLLVVLFALAGVVGMALAVQLVEQGSPEPSGKLFLLGWLETELWVDVPLFLAGVMSVVVAVAIRLRVARDRIHHE